MLNDELSIDIKGEIYSMLLDVIMDFYYSISFGNIKNAYELLASIRLLKYQVSLTMTTIPLTLDCTGTHSKCFRT